MTRRDGVAASVLSCGGVCQTAGRRTDLQTASQCLGTLRGFSELYHELAEALECQVASDLDTELDGLGRRPRGPPQHAEVGLRSLRAEVNDQRICLMQICGVTAH